MSGLYSPLLAQAGFAKRKLASVIEWVAETDGVAQFWQLSESVLLPENSNFKLTFYMLGLGALNTYDGLFESSIQAYTWLRILPSAQSSNFQGYDGTTYFGGVSQSETMVRDGFIHKVTITREIDKLIVQVDDLEPEVMRNSGAGSAWSFDRVGKFSNTYFHGVIYGFEVELEGEVLVSIPLTNKGQGANQLATVGNINAFMPNYTDAVWKNKAELV